MGLELDIRNALIKNIGKEHYNAGNTGQQDRVNKLALDLRNAIIDFLVKQEFNITEMEAPYNILSGKIPVATAGSPSAQTGANTAPVAGIAQISETSNKILDGRVPGAVSTSKVKLLRVFPKSE